MIESAYIRFFCKPSTSAEKHKSQRWRKIINLILFFIPKANPEYDELIEDVTEWQLEIDPIDKLPKREIGKDINGNVILILPWRNNYGFWTDEDITIDYFRDHFKAENIDKNTFDKNWNSFSEKYPE